MKSSKVFPFFFVIIFCYFSILSAQNNHTISGKVYDAKTKEPLPMVNVYLSGTLYGTTTDKEGKYVLLNMPDGKFQLVISIIGYHSKITPIELKNSISLELNFPLNERIYETKPVEISAEVPEEWRDQLEFFKEKLLGNNDYAENCIIKNENKLEFTEDSKVFTASINEPLIIYNYDLGYIVKCMLVSFTYDKHTKITYSSVYTSFTEMHSVSQDSLDNFYDNRLQAFSGSSMHFLTTLVKGKTDPFYVSFYSMNKKGDVNYTQRIDSTGQIMDVDEKTGRYFLNPYKTHLSFFIYKVEGIRIIYKSQLSFISSLSKNIVEFDPDGYFISNDTLIFGDMAKEGVATMLPRFWGTTGKYKSEN